MLPGIWAIIPAILTTCGMLPFHRLVVQIPPGVKRCMPFFTHFVLWVTPNTIPPVYPAVMGTQHLLGCKFTGQVSCISYGYRWDFGCPHPQTERCGQYSCELLARLQEFACTGLQSLLSAQASWLCQVRVTAQRQQENLHLHFVCVCVRVCTLQLWHAVRWDTMYKIIAQMPGNINQHYPFGIYNILRLSQFAVNPKWPCRERSWHTDTGNNNNIIMHSSI